MCGSVMSVMGFMFQRCGGIESWACVGAGNKLILFCASAKLYGISVESTGRLTAFHTSARRRL